MILLDTNVILHFLKGDPAVIAHVRNTSASELALPSVVVYELEFGTLRSKMPDQRRQQLMRGFGAIRSVPFDSNAAISAANVRMELEKKGLTIGPLDLLIAGISLSRGALLVTNNAAKDSRVPSLWIADWRSR